MSSDSSNLLQRASQLIVELNGTVKPQRVKSAKELSKLQLYPELVQNPSTYIKNYITPILAQYEETSEAVREACVNCSFTMIKYIGTSGLDVLYQTIMMLLFKRITKEEVETILYSLMDILLYLAELPSSDTVPQSFDSYTVEGLKALAARSTSKDPKMILYILKAIDIIAKKSSQEKLRSNASLIIPHIIKKIDDRKVEIRKKVIQTLGEFYVASGSLNSFEIIKDQLLKISSNEKSSHRSEFIQFIRLMLTEHLQRSEIFFPLLIPLFYYMFPIVPHKPITYGEKIKEEEQTDEAVLAFDALRQIGEKFENDRQQGLQKVDIQFNSQLTYGSGVIRLIHEHFKVFIDELVPMLDNWQKPQRHFGYFSLSTLLHISSEYCGSFSSEILPKLIMALKNRVDDKEEILETTAILAAFTDGFRLTEVMLPGITIEGPPELITTLSVCLTNSKFEHEQLTQITTSFLDNQVFKVDSCIESLAHCIIAICNLFKSFASSNEVDLLTLMLRVGENSDALDKFGGCFEEPLGDVFGRNLDNLLDIRDRTYKYMTHLLLLVPGKYITNSCDHVSDSVVEVMNCDPSNIHHLYHVLIKLTEDDSYNKINENILSKMIDDMTWRTGKEYVPSREGASKFLCCLLRKDIITTQYFSEIEHRIMPMSLAVLRDESDIVRTTAILTMKEIMSKINDVMPRFDRLFTSFKERLKDPLVSVRVGSVELLISLISKSESEDLVIAQLPECLMFIDDSSQQMRDAISELCYTTAKRSSKYKESILSILADHSTKYYHNEAVALNKEITSKLNQ